MTRGLEMARRSRGLLVGAIGVAAVLGALVVVGRLSSGSLRPSGPPATTATLPALVDHPSSTVPSPVVARIRFRQPVTGVAVGRDAVWVAHGCGISRVDPTTNRVVARVAGIRPRRNGCAVFGVRVGAGAVWASLWGQGLLRIDPRRNRVAGRDFAGGHAMVAADGTVWATSGTTLVPVGDPTRRDVPLVDIADPEGSLDTIGDLAAGHGAIWVAAPAGLYRVDLGRRR